MVGAGRLELPISCSQSRRASHYATPRGVAESLGLVGPDGHVRAGVAQRQRPSPPSWWCGFDFRRPLQLEVVESLRCALAARLGQTCCVDTQVCACLWFGAVSDVFKALADPTRRAILDELAERDDQTLFELCARLTTKHAVASSRQAVSQHVDVLVDAGLVAVRREGRYKFHRLDQRPPAHLTDRWLRPDQEDR